MPCVRVTTERICLLSDVGLGHRNGILWAGDYARGQFGKDGSLGKALIL